MMNGEKVFAMDFGRRKNRCFRATIVNINNEPHLGFIKCFITEDGSRASRTQLFMPLCAYNSFVKEVLPKLTCKEDDPAVAPKKKKEESSTNAFFTDFRQSLERQLPIVDR